QTDQYFLRGPIAEPIDDALDGARRRGRPALPPRIDEGTAFDRMTEVSLLLQPLQNRTHRGFLQRTREIPLHRVGARAAVLPDDRGPPPLEFSKLVVLRGCFFFSLPFGMVKS